MPSPEAAPRVGAPPQELLESRFRLLGLPNHVPVRAHANRSVMVSVTAAGVLRVHEGYALAPDRVLQAIVRFAARGTRRAERLAAQRVLLSFRVHAEGSPARAPRPERDRPGDAELRARLEARWRAFNAEHFGGALQPIPIGFSSRMRRKLGELAWDPATRRPLRITLSRRLLRRFPWREVEATLLHEMVHQWQAEQGHPVDHGREFRRKARLVGIAPSAVMDLDSARAG